MFLCIVQMVNAVLKQSRQAAGSRAGRALLFEGTKREDWRARPKAARKLGALLAECGQIAYWASAPEAEAKRGRHAEHRVAAREKMRLRSAKLLDAAYRFVCECRICDRSLYGIRLLLARNIKLPQHVAVHFDETGEVHGVKVVWRKGPMIGASLRDRAPPGAIKPWDLYALRERYYGILD
jgi:hypothetical protein